MAAQTCRRSGLFGTLLSRCRTLGLGQTRTGPGCAGVCPPFLLLLRAPGAPSCPGCPTGTCYRLSVTDPDRFWGSAAGDRLRWVEPFHRVRDCELSSGKISWFVGGKLNVSENCLDVHVEKHPDRVALIWERDEPGTEVKVTYRELLERHAASPTPSKATGSKKGTG
ncbi:Acetyl-coenzyme A synthetase 2-like, mitochondrial [Larimichthys crocea]|uniref:Acetyl-coenzyme A synthetase 2-like, mitochondrial n=1 Tax=Larimichthys crocea TaxID=215358 RepID=A0A6G0HNS8_LARCR|nr:Acetyl-coenzyme A synthetase 2-like, mitochondrial [Larimichthys crocea]